MTYRCFLESDILSGARMEPLSSTSIDDARCEAARLLAHRPSAYAIHVFEADRRLFSLRQDNLIAPALIAFEQLT